jgi:predicted DsbA family dithiol-disulfide isomerase
MPDRLKIVAYSDYVCPWCFIGLQRIEQLEQEFPVDVEWRPFELHPETPRGNDSNLDEASRFNGNDYLVGRLGSSERARAYRDNIVPLAEDSGLNITRRWSPGPPFARSGGRSRHDAGVFPGIPSRCSTRT